MQIVTNHVPEQDTANYRFVAIVSDGCGNVVAIVTQGAKNFYYDLGGLRNLQSSLGFEERLVINSVIQLVRESKVEDLMVDINAEAGLITTERSNENDHGR